jgi:hypothetical protein
VKPKRKSLGLILLFLVALFSSVCAAERTYSLIVAEYGEVSDDDDKETQTLVRYRFKDGVLVAKESILTTKTSDLRYDLGGTQIYQNRYAISTWGDVIDLTKGEILFKSHGDLDRDDASLADLLGIDRNSNSVMVRVDRDGENGIHAFDLTSHQDRLIEQPGFWAAPGTVSPNGEWSARGDDAEIWLQRRNGDRVLVGSGFGREGSSLCSTNQPTFIWLDDTHLLTQRGNGQLFVVDVEGHMEPLVAIPEVGNQFCGPVLQRDEGNHIYYEGATRQQAWRINVAKRTFGPYLWESRGNGFDVEYQQNAIHGQTIRYRGKKIGQWWCLSWATLTAPGHIAVEFGEVGSDLAHPEGIKVWSAQNRAWTTIEPERLVMMIGWVEE